MPLQQRFVAVECNGEFWPTSNVGLNVRDASINTDTSPDVTRKVLEIYKDD